MATGYAESPATPATTSGLVGITDQLDAAVSDVYQAWSTFRFGASPETASEVTPPRAGDRLESSIHIIQEQVTRLRELAQSIRERA